MTMIFWKAETKCMSSLDHSFSVILAEKEAKKRKRMPLTNRESQAPQDPPKYRATGMLTFLTDLTAAIGGLKSTLALKIQILTQFLLSYIISICKRN